VNARPKSAALEFCKLRGAGGKRVSIAQRGGGHISRVGDGDRDPALQYRQNTTAAIHCLLQIQDRFWKRRSPCCPPGQARRLPIADINPLRSSTWRRDQAGASVASQATPIAVSRLLGGCGKSPPVWRFLPITGNSFAKALDRRSQPGVFVLDIHQRGLYLTASQSFQARWSPAMEALLDPLQTLPPLLFRYLARLLCGQD
jgi:hypothetical protein